MRTKIIGKRFNLRKLRSSDAQSIYEHVNHKGIFRYTVSIPEPYYLKDAKTFINKSIKEWNSKKGYDFGIEIDKEVVGIISLKKIDKIHKNSEIGYWIGRKYWNQGIMSEALNIVLKIAFKDLKLNRVEGFALHPNKASIRVMEKAGFKQEGVSRKSSCKKGEFYDHVNLGILKSDFKN